MEVNAISYSPAKLVEFRFSDLRLRLADRAEVEGQLQDRLLRSARSRAFIPCVHKISIQATHLSVGRTLLSAYATEEYACGEERIQPSVEACRR